MSIKYIIKKFKKFFIYENYDANAYWKKRAKQSGQRAVLWQNEEYNNLYRKIQKGLIYEFIPKKIEKTFRILDIGCGIGIVSKMLVEKHPRISVDAVDFREMIHVAKINNFSERINYIESSAEDYLDISKKYDLIISSACYSMIRDVFNMKKAIRNAILMLNNNGIIIMMDPFHTWNFLARVKFSSRDMQVFMKDFGFELIFKSGVLFWPYRKWLAHTYYSGKDFEKRFYNGEWLLSKLGKHFWADYKILVFKKSIQ